MYNGRNNTLIGYISFVGKEDEKYRSCIDFEFVDMIGTMNKKEGSAAGF